VFLAYVAGQPFGFDVTMSMRSFHIIEGQPTLKPEIQLALVRQAGHSVSVKQSSVDAVVLVGRRSDTGDTAEVSYTIEDAKRANLVGKGNWKTYPEDMLFARAVSRLNRRLFQDVLLGCAYVPEELGATVNPDGDVIDVTPVRALVAEVEDAGDVIEHDDNDDNDDTRSEFEIMFEQDASVDVASYGEQVTKSQLARIHILKDELGITDEKYRAALQSLADVSSARDLTRAGADTVIAQLEQAKRNRVAEEVAQ
jgi:hypothetical protein